MNITITGVQDTTVFANIIQRRIKQGFLPKTGQWLHYFVKTATGWQQTHKARIKAIELDSDGNVIAELITP